jgi:hypothetical protein
LGYMSNHPLTSTSQTAATGRAWLTYPNFPGDIMSGYDVYARHYISPTCYINLEPEWLDMKYWIDMGKKSHIMP